MNNRILLPCLAMLALGTTAWNYAPPSADPAPPVVLEAKNLKRAVQILKGTSIVFQNGKFEAPSTPPQAQPNP